MDQNPERVAVAGSSRELHRKLARSGVEQNCVVERSNSEYVTVGYSLSETGPWVVLTKKGIHRRGPIVLENACGHDLRREINLIIIMDSVLFG